MSEGLIRTPNGEIECKFCTQKFKQAWLGRRHLKTVHQINQAIQCPICLNFYKNENSHQSHMIQKHRTSMKKYLEELQLPEQQ